MHARAQDPQSMLAASRFLGRVEVPLSDTVTLRCDEPRWFPLMRRAAGDAVSGRLQLGFDWDFNARNLLRLKLAALEDVLAQRIEARAEPCAGSSEMKTALALRPS